MSFRPHYEFDYIVAEATIYIDCRSIISNKTYCFYRQTVYNQHVDEKTELIRLLLSYIEQEITVEQLRDALGKIKSAYETNRLLNQINSTNDAEAIQSFVTDALSDLVN